MESEAWLVLAEILCWDVAERVVNVIWGSFPQYTPRKQAVMTIGVDEEPRKEALKMIGEIPAVEEFVFLKL